MSCKVALEFDFLWRLFTQGESVVFQQMIEEQLDFNESESGPAMKEKQSSNLLNQHEKKVSYQMHDRGPIPKGKYVAG